MAEKAKIIPVDLKGAVQISVMYNPNEYTVSYEGKYETDKKSRKQYVITDTPEFKVSLFYDTYEERRDVRSETIKVTSLMQPLVFGKKTRRPPVCLFLWGGFIYQGVITKIEQKFTMFLDNGTPVRCLMDVTFTSDHSEIKLDFLQGLNACRKLWIVKSGDRLDRIANEALKDPSKWRVIAEANKITNPFTFPEVKDYGRTLVIPD